VALFGAVTFSQQDSGELSPAAQERLKQAGASIVIVKASNESGETTAEGRGFFIRKDLIATDSEVVDRNTHHVSVTTRTGAVKVISSGNYFLPYVLLETQPDVSPLPLPDSDRIAANENVYMLSDAGEILTGKITGATKIKNTPAFLVSFAISSTNRGAPIFNRYAEVIGIAAKSPDGQSAGIAWPADQLATLRHLGEPGVGVGAGMGPGFSDNAAPTYKPSPAETVDSKPVRLSSPRPQYTEEARANSIQGTVLLRVQVDIDGSVRGVRVVRGLPYGLSEQAIAVARQTKFKPAMKDGKPVAYWVGMEINFNIF
jgi:TonB family protein